MMNKVILIAACTALFSFTAQAQRTQVKNIKKHIKYLASDKLEGRGTSSIGEDKAALYKSPKYISINKV